MVNYFLQFAMWVAPNVVAWFQASKYILLFLGCIFEGPVVMLTSGFLYRFGTFNLIQMYSALILGDFAADLGWYAFGRFGGRPAIVKWGHRFGITPHAIDKIEHRFNKYQSKILIISKLTMGFGFALVTLVVAGMLKVDFKKYAILNLIGGFFWTAFLLVIGYYFGNIFAMLSGTVKVIFAVAGFAIFIAGIKFGGEYLSRQDI